MQERGLTPRLVENVIQNGEVQPDPIPSRIRHFDRDNNVTVVTDRTTGNVVTVRFGTVD
jgi:hypothetical protein